jgi:hypothetical protein
MNILKSISAIVAGFLVVVFLSVLTDLLFEVAGVFPSANQPEAYTAWMLGLALAYRLAYTVFGGAITAWLAPKKKMVHVWVLAGIGQLAGISGVIQGWDLSAHWYTLAIAITAIPCVWLGGWLATKNKKRK